MKSILLLTIGLFLSIGQIALAQCVTVTATPGACNGDTYTLTGTFVYNQDPGNVVTTVAATDGVETYTQNFNPPFVVGQVYTYSITNIPGNGSPMSVAVGSIANPQCFGMVDYLAPNCDVQPGDCNIISLTTNPGACNAENNYTLTGTVTYNNSPAQGSLQITVSNGTVTQTTVLNPPFTNNQAFNYSFSGLPADGAATTVVASFTNDQGCTRTSTFSAPGCNCIVEADFLALSSELTDEDPTTQFVNVSLNTTSYRWVFGDGFESNTENPKHTFPEQKGSYSVKLIANGSNGCVDSTSMVIQVTESLIYYMPNAFTPDGDEANQYFTPVFKRGFDPYNFNMKIYNRWGEVVFETNDVTVGWDGTYNGEVAKEGGYVWKMEFKKLNVDERIMKVGHVTLTR